MTRYDALVIGADGIAAAALLAKAGQRVLLVRDAEPSSVPGALHALDPELIRQLRLTHFGLSFLQRDLPLVALRDDAPALVLPRDRHGAAAALGPVSAADAAAWPAVQRQMLRRARALRRWWEHPLSGGRPDDVLHGRDRATFAWLQWATAEAWSASQFESESLRGALLFDAVAGGFAPSEPGTALALVWRAAQEMAGLQGAVALPSPGSLEVALRLAAEAAGVETAHGVVTRILLNGGRADGVVLADGEIIEARVILSALPRPQTLALLGSGVGEVSPVAEARLLLRLQAPHGLPPGRYVVAGNAAHQTDAYEAARGGRLIADPPLEFVPVASDQLAVTLRPVPVAAFDPALLAAHAIRAMARHVPGLGRGVAGVAFAPVTIGTRASLTRLAAPALARAATPAANVFVCGADAEPVAGISGRACRFAAHFALRMLY